MPNLVDILEYVEVAFKMASIPPEEYTFRQLLLELSISGRNITADEFSKAPYHKKVILLEDATKVATDNLSNWLADISEDKIEYYKEKLMAYMKAFQLIELKSAIDTENVVYSHSFIEEHLTDQLLIDNDPELNKIIEPLLDQIKKSVISILSQNKVTPTQPVISHTDTNSDIELPSTIQSKEPEKENLSKASRKQLITHKEPDVIPKQKFRRIITDVQHKKLIAFLELNEYVNKPNDFVDFLIGENDGSKVKVTESNKPAVCYLIFLLHRKKYIKLNYDRNYQQYIEDNFCPFTNFGVKGQFKNYIRLIQRNRKLRMSTGKELHEFVDGLNTKLK